MIQKVFRSKEQTYEFDFPYQCGQNCDLPYDAQDNKHQIEHNDIIVMGTDGVFDNLFDSQISDVCIRPHLKFDGNLLNPQNASQCVSSLAEALSYNQSYVSPYTQGAIDHGLKKEDNLGGKPDDITVIVA